MPQKVFELKQPHGLSRLAFRTPIWLYRLGLGWLLGHRFLRLTHTGRKSGLPRQSVLEMVRYDKTNGACIVASGWGEKSDWYRNITAHPQVTVQVGNRRFAATAERLTAERGGQELAVYAHKHPIAFGELEKFMGVRVDGTEEDILALGKIIPMFIFKPLP